MPELPIVVLDPGHGGTKKIGGSSANNATGPNGLLEKNLTLDIARRSAALLAPDARVILTRADDSNLSLKARADVARKNGAAVFLSIHLNGWHDAQVDGTETWVAKDATRRSRDFAAAVLKSLLAVTKVADRGVREANFGVILTARHHATTAVCLAEIAFLTNPAQARRLESADYRQAIAAAFADAVRLQLPAVTAAAKSFAAAGAGSYGGRMLDLAPSSDLLLQSARYNAYAPEQRAHGQSWDTAEALQKKGRRNVRRQPAPHEWAKDVVAEGARRFKEFGEEFTRLSNAVYPGVPPEALMGCALNGKPGENTTGFITGLEDERPPQRETPPLGGVASQNFHELGMFGVEGGPRKGPAPGKNSRWSQLAASDEVKKLLGRPGKTEPGSWRSLQDQLAIGLVNTRKHGRDLVARQDFPAQIRPASESSLWFVALSFMAWSAGGAGAAHHLSGFAKELAAVPEQKRWGAFIRLLAEAGEQCKLVAAAGTGPGGIKHRSPFFSALRTLQKIEGGFLLAQKRGVNLSFFDDDLGTDRAALHETITRLANEGNASACGGAAQALGKPAPPEPTRDQVVQELDKKLGTSYGTYDGYVKDTIKSASVLGKSIGGGLHPDFRKKLEQGEQAVARLIHPDGSPVTAAEWGVKSIGGYQRREGRGGWHPWGLAIDVDYLENPYIMHESGEPDMDKRLKPVYHRIARLMLERDSVIPEEITKTQKGETKADRTSRLYDALLAESRAMVAYFALMSDAAKVQKQLDEIAGDSSSRVLAEANPKDAKGLQQLMLRDYVTLSGREGPAIAGLTYPDPAKLLGKLVGQAPFYVGKGKDEKAYQDSISRRAPERGFLTIRKEIVMGLTSANLRWGAIDLGGASGDVMHFDDGNGRLAGNIAAAKKAAQEKLASTAQSFDFSALAFAEDDDEGLPLARPLARPALTAKDVKWADDNQSPDYRHLGVAGVSQAFDFNADHLAQLCQLNSFNPNLTDDDTDDREVIFALRGCMLVGGTVSGDATSPFVASVTLSEDMPNHQTSHCVIGVWKRSTKRLAAFSGSTVPWWGSMEKFRQGGPASNMLLTGRHVYNVGTHRGGSNLEIRGALLQQGPVVVVRTFDDLCYEVTDTFEVGNVGDNIHPSRFAGPADRYSSQGCLTVPGTYDLNKERYTGLWSRFRGALGLNATSPQSSEDGRRFVCILLTGREARLVAQKSSVSLKRIRFGSQGADVTALQNALKTSGHFNGKVNGQMGPSTIIAYINWQRDQNPSNPSADGIKKLP
jgi:N-acetylmuramoyl-L-alanine amidase